jgi:hypothetical protein
MNITGENVMRKCPNCSAGLSNNQPASSLHAWTEIFNCGYTTLNAQDYREGQNVCSRLLEDNGFVKESINQYMNFEYNQENEDNSFGSYDEVIGVLGRAFTHVETQITNWLELHGVTELEREYTLDGEVFLQCCVDYTHMETDIPFSKRCTEQYNLNNNPKYTEYRRLKKELGL